MIEHELSESFDVYRLLMYKLRNHCNNYAVAAEEFAKLKEAQSLAGIAITEHNINGVIKEIVDHVQSLKELLTSAELDLFVTPQGPSKPRSEFEEVVEQVNISHFYAMLDCLNGTCAATIANKQLDSHNAASLKLSQLESVKKDLDEAIKVFNINNLGNCQYKLYTGLETLRAVSDEELRIVKVVERSGYC